MSLFADYRSRAPTRPATEPPPDLDIGPGVHADCERLARIAHERNGGEFERHLAGFQREVDLPADTRILHVARRNGGVVGFGRANRFAPDAGAPENVAPAGWYLGGLVVAPDHRRLGIGAELTRRRLLWIAERANEAWYFANALNRATIDLHARFGFLEVTRDFWFPGVTFTGGVGVLFRVELPGRLRSS